MNCRKGFRDIFQTTIQHSRVVTKPRNLSQSHSRCEEYKPSAQSITRRLKILIDVTWSIWLAALAAGQQYPILSELTTQEFNFLSVMRSILKICLITLECANASKTLYFPWSHIKSQGHFVRLDNAWPQVTKQRLFPFSLWTEISILHQFMQNSVLQ